MSLSSWWNKHPKRFIRDDFTLLPRIEQLYAVFAEKPLVTINMDHDQIWTQLKEEIDNLQSRTLKKLHRIERKALKLAEQEEEKQQQSDHEEEQEEEIQEEQPKKKQKSKQVKTKKTKKDVKEVKPQVRPKKQTVNEEVDEFLRLEKYLDEMDQKKDDDSEEDDEDEEDNQNEDDNQQEVDEEMQEEQENDEMEDEEMENSIFDEMREVEMDNDKEIEELQNKLLAPKDWQMLGEVSSRARPLNSLLDEQLDFKANIAQHEQMITKEYQNTLEEKIRKRVADELWDDRTRKSLSNAFQENFGSKREAHELNHNKSQLGLAELMEHEFKNALGLPTNSTEKNAKQELFNIFRDLCFKLDSLTNLNFQPRGFVKPGEIKVSSTIDREEKVPLTYTKSGAVEVTKEKLPKSFVSREEATTEEKRARRNLKKQKGIKLNKIKKAKQPRESRDAIWEKLKDKKKVKPIQ